MKIKRLFTKRFGDRIEQLSDEQLEEVYSLNRAKFLFFTVIGYIFLGLIVFSALKFFDIKQSMLISLLVIMFHFIISWFNIIGKDELGSIYFFEKPLFNTGRGIKFVLALLCTLDREKRTIFEDELPANDNLIYRPNVGEPNFVPPDLLALGYKAPLRVTFKGEKNPENSNLIDDPLKERITAETPGIVLWHIRDLIKFRSTIGTPEKAREQMADIYIAVVTTALPKITLAQFYEEKDKYDNEIYTALEILTDNWGIAINNAKIKEIVLSRKFNKELLEMASSMARKRSDELSGKGSGAREYAILEARTKGLKYMAEELGVEPESVLSMESARDIANKVNNLVLAGGKGGYTDLIGMVAAGTAALPPKEKADEKKEPNKNGGES